jgi:3-hydroxyacyl-[acyl-carrier-protein] dehydratase
MSQPHPTLAQIHRSIPHRAPMLLVDEIVSLDDQSIVCRKQFHADEYFFQGHYPDHPIVPGVILCESAVQSGAILLADVIQDSSDKVPVLTRMGDVKFKRIVHPGEVIENSVKIDEVVSTAYYMTAQVRCDGKLAARLSFTCSLAPKGS